MLDGIRLASDCDGCECVGPLGFSELMPEVFFRSLLLVTVSLGGFHVEAYVFLFLRPAIRKLLHPYTLFCGLNSSAQICRRAATLLSKCCIHLKCSQLYGISNESGPLFFDAAKCNFMINHKRKHSMGSTRQCGSSHPGSRQTPGHGRPFSLTGRARVRKILAR